MSGGGHPFDEYVRRPADEIRLAHAALLFARDEYPALDQRIYLRFLDHLAERVRERNPVPPLEQVEALREVIVGEERLTGAAVEDYRNPENSYLNRVIERRSGIPISLSAIWLDVSSATGIPLLAIGTPGHFLLRHAELKEPAYIDPYRSGELYTSGQVRAMLSATLGGQDRIPQDAFAPVDVHYTLRRMLGNLYTCYRSAGDAPRVVTVLHRLIAVVPEEVVLRAELARMLAVTGAFRKAAAVIAEAKPLALDDQERDALDEVERDIRRRHRETN